MKIKYLLVLSAIFLIISPVYANISNNYCLNFSISAHCAYPIGLPDHEGRWIKVKSNEPVEYQKSTISCLGNNGAINTIFPLSGKYHEEYSVCKDIDGSGCQLIGSEDFEVSDVVWGISSSASSQFYEIDLSSIAKNTEFPNCKTS